VKHRRFLLPMLALVLCAAPEPIAADWVSVGIGHSGSVRTIASHPTEQFAFTGGDDGALSVWSLPERALYERYQISAGPITAIAHHPNRDELVLFAMNSVTSGTLICLNWRSGEERFRRDLDAIPSYLAYSPAGSYIVYATPTFRSLYFLSSDNGSVRPYLQSGFGAVGFVQMGRSETNLMTYLPSRGEFVYWGLESGEELRRVETASRLEHLTIIDTATRRFLAASDGTNLLVVDNYTGEVKAQYPASPIFGITYSESTGVITVLTQTLGNSSVLSFTFSQNRLRRHGFVAQNLSDDATVFEAVGTGDETGYVSGSASGVVAYYLSRTGRRTVMGPVPIDPVAAVAVTDGRLHLLVDDRITTIASDFFDEDNVDHTVTFIRESELLLPGIELEGMVADGERLLLWGSDEDGAGVWSVRPPGTQAAELYRNENGAGIARVRPTEGRPVVVHRDGRIVQVGPTPSLHGFEYAALGAQDVFWSAATGLIAAKTRTSSFDSSLVVIDLSTEETVPIESAGFLTLRVAVDPRAPTLYSLSLAGAQSSPETTLSRYSGRGFSRPENLTTLSGEYPRADIVWDRSSASLFSSLADPGVIRYNGRSATEMERARHLSEDLMVHGTLLVAHNADGTVTIWDSRTGEHLFDIYIFQGGDWLASTLHGAFRSSSAAAERYLTLHNEKWSRLTLDDYRIELPFRP
jgi:WD40 repeat protein